MGCFRCVEERGGSTDLGQVAEHDNAIVNECLKQICNLNVYIPFIRNATLKLG